MNRDIAVSKKNDCKARKRSMKLKKRYGVAKQIDILNQRY